jgi:hypothetical protein
MHELRFFMGGGSPRAALSPSDGSGAQLPLRRKKHRREEVREVDIKTFDRRKDRWTGGGLTKEQEHQAIHLE